MQNSLPSRALKLIIALLAAAVFTIASATSAVAATANWAFSAMSVPSERPQGDGVRVAVIDSGIDTDHPAFDGRIAAAVDCVDSGGEISGCTRGVADDNGHGTHIAGIIGARSVDGGPEGIAPKADLLAIRALSNTCEGEGTKRECRALGQVDDVVAAIRIATQRDADVINLSIDAGVDLDWDDSDLADAISDAWDSGAVVVASTGNRDATIEDPDLGAVPMLLVGALAPDGTLAAYSNRAPTARWSLLAPGGEAGGDCPDEGVLSTYPTDLAAAGTGCLAGTSMAAAYVSGALASIIGTGVEPHTALAHLLATASTTVEGAEVDLDAALTTPVDQAAGAFTAGRDDAPSTSNEDSDDSVFSASGLPLERWTRVHPIRTRAAGVLSIAVAAVVVIATRRRSAVAGPLRVW